MKSRHAKRRAHSDLGKAEPSPKIRNINDSSKTAARNTQEEPLPDLSDGTKPRRRSIRNHGEGRCREEANTDVAEQPNAEVISVKRQELKRKSVLKQEEIGSRDAPFPEMKAEHSDAAHSDEPKPRRRSSRKREQIEVEVSVPTKLSNTLEQPKGDLEPVKEGKPRRQSIRKRDQVEVSVPTKMSDTLEQPKGDQEPVEEGKPRRQSIRKREEVEVLVPTEMSDTLEQPKGDHEPVEEGKPRRQSTGKHGQAEVEEPAKQPEADAELNEEEKPRRRSMRKQEQLVANLLTSVGDLEHFAVDKPLLLKPHWSDRSRKSTRLIDLEDQIVSCVLECSRAKGGEASLTDILKVARERCAQSHAEAKAALTSAVKAGKIEICFKCSYKVVPSSAPKVASRKRASTFKGHDDRLLDLLPTIFTWINHPKQSTLAKIEEYLTSNFPSLITSNDSIKRALEAAVDNGQLIKIEDEESHFVLYELVDEATKSGTSMENAFEDAIIATSEPKKATYQELFEYVAEYHKEFKVKKDPTFLLETLDSAQRLGWIHCTSGHGKTGRFTLGHPFSPSPQTLWRECYNEGEYMAPKTKKFMK